MSNELVKTCEYCGRGDVPLFCEGRFCNELHRYAQEIWLQGEFVACPECGVILSRLEAHMKFRHDGAKYRVRYTSKKQNRMSSEAKKGERNPMKNKINSNKVSVTNKGRRISLVMREKISRAGKGKKRTVETCERIRASQLAIPKEVRKRYRYKGPDSTTVEKIHSSRRTKGNYGHSKQTIEKMIRTRNTQEYKEQTKTVIPFH